MGKVNCKGCGRALTALERRFGGSCVWCENLFTSLETSERESSDLNLKATPYTDDPVQVVSDADRIREAFAARLARQVKRGDVGGAEASRAALRLIDDVMRA